MTMAAIPTQSIVIFIDMSLVLRRSVTKYIGKEYDIQYSMKAGHQGGKVQY